MNRFRDAGRPFYIAEIPDTAWTEAAPLSAYMVSKQEAIKGWSHLRQGRFTIMLHSLDDWPPRAKVIASISRASKLRQYASLAI